jgi:hypothetical protein
MIKILFLKSYSDCAFADFESLESDGKLDSIREGGGANILFERRIELFAL